MVMLVAFAGLRGWLQEPFMGDAENGDAYENGDEISHTETGSDNEVGIIEGLEGADRGDWIENGCGEHVGESAGDGEPVLDETPDDGNDCAFTDREDGSEKSTGEDGEDGVFRENLLEGIAREIGPEEAADEGAKENERKALEEDREKFVGAVLKLIPCAVSHLKIKRRSRAVIQ
jgi:hypothetical protein